MTDADGLVTSALLYGASLLLIAIGYRISRKIVRTPAALLAIATAALGSFLLVKHAPAGAEWSPLEWTPPEPKAGPAVRLSFPLRQRSLTDGADDSSGRGGRLEPRNTSRGGGGEDDQTSGSSPGGGGGAGSGRGLLAGLFAPVNSRKPMVGDVTKDCPFCPEIVIVPGGQFVMGSADTDAEATAAEKPARDVKLWPGFAIGRYEVTVGEFTYFTKMTGRSIPSCAGAGANEPTTDERLPMSCVDWRDAAAYAGWLRGLTGKPYRLPTAAEWEYAARAEGAEPHKAHLSVSSSHIMRVESTLANAWSVHGMRGNLAEIVADCWQPTLADYMPDPGLGCSTRMIKDGGWSEQTRWQRATARRAVDIGATSPSIGFRIARDLR